MRIALLDANPRICGPMSWMKHLANGYTRLGHEAHIVSATKSGRTRSAWGNAKWGNQWSLYTPDVVVKYANLVETLDSYDFIILPEPRVPSEDKAALKRNDLPPYVDALLRTTTPFTTAFHGNDYWLKDTPFGSQLLTAQSFCGTLISHSERSVGNTDLPLDGVNVVPLPLPYDAKIPIDAPAVVSPTVGMTGRFMYNKGQPLLTLAMISNHMLKGTLVELWGSASAGLGPNVTYTTYEGLLPFASHAERFGDQEERRASGYEGVIDHGNTIRPYLWNMTFGSNTVQYLGNYTDPIATCQRLGVHVNLTGLRFSGGLVEYSTLEAMDAGSRCVTTRQVSDSRYVTHGVTIVDPPGTTVRLLKDEARADAARVEAVVSDALAAVHSSPTHRDESVRHNREMIRKISGAEVIGQRILEECM